MQQAEGEYLYNHGVSVALLSMAVASQLGMTREETIEIGLGALLHDVGMLRVPADIRNAPRPLTTSERLVIEQHPVYTLDYLEHVRGLPTAVGLIAYHAHERLDASGYPRRRSGQFIHQYAKIVSLADAYTAMTTPRPYRLPILPYVAAKTVLLDGSVSKYDRTVVRAFLDCVSLFPIGSFVRLNDGAKARVIRTNPGSHTQPVVELLDAGQQTHDRRDPPPWICVSRS